MAPTKFEQFCGAAPGDVDGSTGVDVTDALLVAMYTQGQELPTSTCDARIAFGCADVNADSSTDVLDALLIARAYVGLVDLAWPGPPSAAPTTAVPTTEAPTFATEPPTERPSYAPSARPTSRPSTSGPSYAPSARPTTLWDPSPAPTAPSYASASKEGAFSTSRPSTRPVTFTQVRTDGGGHVRPDARLVRGALVSAFRPAKLRPYDLHAYCTSVTRSLFSDAAPFGGPILRDAATKHGNAYDALAVIGTDLCDKSTNVFAAAIL